MTGRAIHLRIDRAHKDLPVFGRWNEWAYQGPGGLYAVEHRHDGTYQVHRLTKEERRSVRISEPFMTPEGARKFAERLAGGGDSSKRFG